MAWKNGCIQSVSKWNCLISSVYDFQSLIVGFLAIGAAYYAARPVWKQLRELQFQRNLDAKRYKKERLAELQAITKKTIKGCNDFSRKIAFEQSQSSNDTSLEADFAFEMEQTAIMLSISISSLQKSKLLPHALESQLTPLTNTLAILEKLFDDIHRPDSFDFDDPDFRINSPKEAKKAAEKQASNAQKLIVKAINDFEKEREGFNNDLKVFQFELAHQIQGIDEELLESH